MRIALILTIALLLQGCASFSAHEGVYMSCSVREDPRNDSPSPIFGGVTTDVYMIAGCLSSPIVALWDEDIKGWEIFFTPLPIIDLPFSCVADLLYLPSDIAYWSEWKKAQLEKKKDSLEQTH